MTMALTQLEKVQMQNKIYRNSCMEIPNLQSDYTN